MKNIFILFLIGVTLVSCGKKTISSNITSYEQVTSNSFCPESWFPHKNTPPPSEGHKSPFDTINTTMAIFHQWSWQKFLWLTRPVKNGMAFFQDSLVLIDKDLQEIASKKGVKLILKSTNQAGGGNMGVLTSNPKFNNQKRGDTVFYAIYVNQLFLDSARTMKKYIMEDTTHFNNNLSFPVGAFEIKTSWIKTTAIPKDSLSTYYTTDAYFTKENEIKEVALLGMHIVGIVKNHPEFIWSTFEHKDLAPIYTLSDDSPVTSDKEMLFFRKGDTATIQNLKKGNISKSVFSIYKYGIPKVNKDSFMVTSQREPQNYDHLDSMNNCVSAKLKDVWRNYFNDGSVWLETDNLTRKQQTDSIVTMGPNLHDFSSGHMARGSANSSNITMETFMQIPESVSSLHSITIDKLKNCFSCHNANFKNDSITHKDISSPLYISHIFRNYLGKEDNITVSIRDID